MAYGFSPYGLDLEQLRLRNLLSPQQSQEFAIQSVNNDDEMHDDEFIPKFNDELMKQYQDLIQRRPVRPNKPGRLKRIQAGIATLASPDPVDKERLRDNVLYGNYNRELGDWEDQLKNFKSLSEMEGSRNINERVATSSAQREKARLRQLDLTEKRNEQLANKENADIDIKRMKAETYVQVGKARAWKLQNPQYKFETGKDGKVYGINQADPSDVVDTGIESRFLDDMDKADLQLRNRLSAIRATGEENRKTKETIPGRNPLTGTSSTGRIESGSSVKARNYTKAREAYNTHPEWQPYINFMQGNDFEVRVPSSSGIGPWKKAGGDPAVAQQINDYIYGKTTQPTDKNKQSNVAAVEGDTPEFKAKVDKARMKVEPGYKLITDGKNFGQVKSNVTVKAPWREVK